MLDYPDRLFRSRLKRELPAWRAEGLVDDDAARKLIARYELDAPDEEGRNLATLAVYILGVILIGGGVVSLIAWNWEALPASAKLLLVGAVMVAAHFYGYRGWKVDGRRPRLGHALTVLGTLIFGADIGLVAQVFHISGHWPDGFLAWAVGAYVAALAYGSVPQAVVAIATAFVAWIGQLDAHRELVPLTAFVFPIAFLPLAWRHRSRLLFQLTAVALGVALPMGVGEVSTGAGAAFLAVCATAGWLLAWPYAFPPGHRARHFDPVARTSGLAVLVGAAFVFSFYGAAHDLHHDPWEGGPIAWLPLVIPFAFTAWGLARSAPGGAPWTREAPAATVALWAVPALAIAAAIGTMPLTVAANAIVAGIVAVCIAGAVGNLERGPFWMGSLLGGALVVARFFEFDTDLWLKALAFIGAGVALISVGLAFERRVQRRAAHGA
jgi:uncharacterized membrane protein